MATAAALPAHLANAARHRGQARDLDVTVAELLADSGASVTGSPDQSRSFPEETS